MKFNFKKARKAFNIFCEEKGLKYSKRRYDVLNALLVTGHHVSANELYETMRRKGMRVGYSTVFRTLKLLVEAGIASAVDLGRGELCFEPKWGLRHHDHLVCRRCGKVIEFSHEGIERSQREVAEEHNFLVKSHELQIFGLCDECQRKEREQRGK